MVKRSTNSLIKQITQSEISLFVALIFALGNLLTFLDNNDLGGIILFFIVAFLIMMKSKNMVIVLGGAIIITNITVIILKSVGLSINTPVGVEGFKEGQESSKKTTPPRPTPVAKPNPKPNKVKPTKSDDEEEDDNIPKSREALSTNMKKLKEKLNSSGKASSKENMKVAQEALSKLEPLMDRAEGLMQAFTKMGGGKMMDSFLGGTIEEEDD